MGVPGNVDNGLGTYNPSVKPKTNNNMIGALIAAGSAIAGGIMDIAQQKKAVRQQRKLNQENQAMQLDTWEKTNYPQQRKMMEEAGLNPGLMYGMGGGGGATIGTQGSNVPQQQGNFSQMGLQLSQQMQLMEAQKENIQANTEKTKTETDKLAGIDTEEGRQRILSGLKGIELNDAQINQLAKATNKTEEEIKNLIKGREIMDKEIEKTDKEIEEIAQAIGKSKEEVKNLIATRGQINATTANIKKDTELKGEQIDLTDEQRKNYKQARQKIIADMLNDQIRIEQKDIELQQGEWIIKNEAVKQKIDAKLRAAGIDLQNKEINRRMYSDILRIFMGIQPTPNVIGF